MELIETVPMPEDPGLPQSGADPADGAARHELCETCGVPVALDQRYCVNCGKRLSAATDPAAEYLGRASVNARAVASAATRARRRRRGPRLASVVGVAAVPLVVAIGIGIGRSSSAGDGQLAARLQAQSRALQAALRAEHAGARKPSSTRTTATSSGTTSRSKSTTAGQTTNSTQKQLSQGASATHKVQNSTGSGYVNSQKGLPNEVVIP